MKHFENRIISASAGTGKTYRLSLEYLSLILRYYEHPDFSIDSILALTFTRKATAEIRERVMLHLEDLIKKQDDDLLKSLRDLVPGETAELSAKEQGILISAYHEILADKAKLKVMTIDSYISSIFRNVVRPLRSIDHYEIDLDAVKRRMPFLMNHLMLPRFRTRVDRLLVRKVKRSLDDYAGFFTSLIRNRWLYYLILHRYNPALGDRQEMDQEFIFFLAMEEIFQTVEEVCSSKGKSEVSDYYNSAFRNLLEVEDYSFSSVAQRISQIISYPQEAYEFLKVLASSNIYNGVKIRGANAEDLKQKQALALRALADLLYFRLYLPEQQEILDLWMDILEEYDRLIYKYKNLTYDDVAWFTFEALFSQEPPIFDLSDENTATEFYEFLSHRTRFMLIDEFQDTSLIQFNILQPIMEEICSGIGSKELGGIIVVGDEKQSIFGWRGGERDLLLNLKSIIHPLNDVKLEYLSDSWRSSPDMMRFVNTIFSHDTLHHFLALQGMNWVYHYVDSALDDMPTELHFKTAGYKNSNMDKRRVYRDFVHNMILPVLHSGKDESIAILCRKGAHLSEIQMILEEEGQLSIFQPSAPLNVHQMVAPLISWLRFVVYQDWMDFLAFLRSNYLMLGSQALKQVVDIVSAFEEAMDKGSGLCDFSVLPVVDNFYKLALKHQNHDVPYIIREIMDNCLKGKEVTTERDYLNLQAFLGIAIKWDNQPEHSGIAQFLDYVNDNSGQENFVQVSVEGEEGVQLLTIHKSKGLQFDRVFVYYDLSEGGRSDVQKLFWSINYADDSFHDISEYALSYHYDAILRHSSAYPLWEKNQKRALLEELNTLYVAFTRAKTAMHIYFGYCGTKGWQEYISAKEEADLKLPAILAAVCTDYFHEVQPDENGIYLLKNDYPSEMQAKFEEKKLKTMAVKPEALSDKSWINWDLARPQEQSDISSWRKVYLEDRQHLYGDLTHYYLSYIKYNLVEEHVRADSACIARYGSLLPVHEIQNLIQKICQALKAHAYLFDKIFDKVFTEFEVYNNRIDRLMVDSNGKKAVVIDYKTGGIYEQDQLENYAKILAGLPVFAGYEISTKYVMLEV